jgi:hypothetical protein
VCYKDLKCYVLNTRRSKLRYFFSTLKSWRILIVQFLLDVVHGLPKYRANPYLSVPGIGLAIIMVDQMNSPAFPQNTPILGNNPCVMQNTIN